MMTTIRVLLVAMILIAAVEYKSSEGEEMAGRGGAIAPSAVYRIICIDRKTGGTGFGHRSGRILTAAHVVEGCDLSKIIVIAYPNVTTTVSAIVADSTIDLALLTPSAADFVKHSFPIWTGDTRRPSVDVGIPRRLYRPSSSAECRLLGGRSRHQWN